MKNAVGRSATRDLIEGVFGLGVDTLRPEDLAATRSLLLDHISVTAAGAQTATAQAARKVISPSEIGVGFPLIGTSGWAEPVDAAFANAVAGHCLEFDDTHSGSSLHPGVVVFPAAMAASCIAGASSEAFIEGVVAGYEVMCRVGRAVDPAAHYRRHFHPTATTGHLAAAATAARILGLDVEEATQAVGTACTMASGSLEFLSDGAWTKRLHPGLAVRNGVLAAQLVREGFEGPRDGIGGTHGFLATFTDDPHPERLVEGLSTANLELRNTSIKAHGCCRYNQGPIDAVLDIRNRDSVSADDIRRIRVGVVSAALTLVWNPPDAKRRPSSVVEAQFSLPYSIAIAIRDGNADPSKFDPVVTGDRQLQRLMDLVECIPDPELNRDYPDRWRCWVEIQTLDGRTLTSTIDEPKGEPGNPFTDEELLRKAKRLTANIYSPSRLAAIASTVSSIPDRRSLDELKGLLPADL